MTSSARTAYHTLALIATLAPAACDSTAPKPAPDPPTPVAAVPTSDRRINVTWGLPSSDVTEVRLERAEGSGQFAPLTTLTGPLTTFGDTGLTPATSYRYRVQACNTNGCSAFTEPVAASTFTTLALIQVAPPSVVVGDVIAPIALQTSGGNGPVTFAVAAGALPPGLTLGTGGVISGTPTTPGQFSFTVQATSGDGQSATLTLALVVRARIAIVTTALPNAIRGQAYSASVVATDADSVYTWFVEAGSLPAGLVMSNLGIISGSPTTEQLAHFTTRVRSGDGQTAVRDFTITVTAPVSGPALSIRTSILPPALASSPYGPGLAFSGGNGSQVGWSVVSGALPPGVTLGTGGVFTGTPTAVGTYSFTARAANAAGQSDQKALSLRVVANDQSRFNVTRLDVAPVSAAIDTHVQAAIARWEQVIQGDLSTEEIPRGFFRSTNCGGFGDIPQGTSVDDLLILVNIAPIDGRGSTLGQSSICGVRDEGSLPIVGWLTLDSDDLQSLVGTNTLTDIITHEIGHILGFGILWNDQGFGFTTGLGTSDPRYTGPAAVREWRALGGTGNVPLEATGGPGTAESHWRETTFRTELMTGYVSQVGVANPLSRVTIGEMEDLGYVVNYGAADAYTLPGTALMAPPAEPLGHDEVVPGPILVVPRK